MEDNIVEGWCVLNSCFRGEKRNNPDSLPEAGVIFRIMFSAQI